MAEKKPSEVLGGWNRQVAEQLGQIADNTGGEGTAQAGSEKRPSDVLGGWYKEVSDLLDDIATNTEGGEYVLPTMSTSVKGGATVGEGLTMDGTALSVDFTEVASVDALEEATALSPTGGIVSTQDGLAIDADVVTPPDGSVTTAKLADGAVTIDKINPTVTSDTYNIAKDVEVGKRIDSSGNIINGSVSYIGCTHKLPCDSSTAYTISTKGVYATHFAVAFYDSNESLIGNVISPRAGANDINYIIVYAPSNATYMAFSADKSGANWNGMQCVKGVFVGQDADTVSFRDDVARNYMAPIGNVYCTLPHTDTDGCYGTNGHIGPVGSYGEKCTDLMYVGGFKKVSIALVPHTFVENRYLIYLNEWDNSKTHIQRRQLFLDYVTGLNITYEVPDNVKYIAVSFRTFGWDYDLLINGMNELSDTNGKINAVYEGIADTINATSKFTKYANIQDGINMPSILKPCWDHCFIDHNGTAANPITIPHESVYHVNMAARMGFKVMELHIHKTTDGEYFTGHSSGGNFGYFCKSTDPNVDVQNTNVESVTWNWIETYVRYNSVIPKYQTRPSKLSEVLVAMKQHSIIPMATIDSIEVKEYIEKYLGQCNYVAYQSERSIVGDAPIMGWHGGVNASAILAECRRVGRPYIYGMYNYTSFTDDELLSIADALHSEGFHLLTSYNDRNWYRAQALGFDFNTTERMANRVSVGNKLNLDSTFGFDGYSIVNGQIADVISFSTDGTVTPNATLPNGVYLVDIELLMSGSITLPPLGEMFTSYTYTSDGSYPIFVTTLVMDSNPIVTIQVSSGSVIQNIFYKVSEI
jgi:hypothetical protein